MPVTREEAAVYAASEFGELLVDAGIPPTEAGGLKTAIDRALLTAGHPIEGPAPAGSELGFFALLDWAVLSRVERALALRVDVTVEGPSQSKRYSQAVDHVRGLREQAWQRAQQFLGETSEEWEVGTVSLGIVALPQEGAWW